MPIPECMKPRFGIITRLIATTFALGGIGAALATYGVRGRATRSFFSYWPLDS